jgi:hypothetical protein
VAALLPLGRARAARLRPVRDVNARKNLGLSPADSLHAAARAHTPPITFRAVSYGTDACAVCGGVSLSSTLIHDRDGAGERIKRHKGCKP